MLRILHNTNIDFISRWRAATITLIAFLVPALIWMVVSLAREGSVFKMGLEFTGGTMVRTEFQAPPDLSVVRQTVAGAGIQGAEIQTYGSPREVIIRAQEREHVQAQAAGAETVVTRIEQALVQRFGRGSFRVLETEGIGPRVGDELRRNAIIAMLISFVVSLIYLAARFEWRFGLAAVLANMHDIIATFAFIKYAQIEITLFVVAGILTVIGYSLSDTVVVFDRVRELLRKGERVPLRDTLNRSLNETLPRTVMTGTTVIACLLALVLLGGEVLRPFALVLLFGIIVGTLSSIYVAAPLLLLIERRWPRHSGESKGMARAVAADRKQQQGKEPSRQKATAR
jgi:preprotein translocase subunit SecF